MRLKETRAPIIKKLYKLWYDVNKIFENNNLEYWASGGTLLGTIRHNGIIPWDDDLDVCVYDVSKFLKLKPQLEKCGYTIAPNKLFGYKVIYKNIRLMEGKNYSFPNLDIFIMEKNKNYYQLKYVKGRQLWPKEKYYYKNLFPLKKYKFGKTYMLGPNNPIPYLDRTYGKSWNKIAYREYDHEQDEEIEKVKITLTEDERVPAKPVPSIVNRKCSRKPFIKNPNPFCPRIIWTFWNSDELPITVQKSIDTWKYYNPNYSIRILNIQNTYDWIPEVDVLNLKRAKDYNFTRLSDFVRINVLYKYGGIWIDSTTICTMPFDEWFQELNPKKNIEYIGYYGSWLTSKKQYPIIENWFFACKKHSKFMKLWRDEFMSINKYNRNEDYLNYVEDELGVDFQNIPEYDDPDYLTMHISAQVVLQNMKYSQKSLLLLDASKKGPLSYIVKQRHLTDKQQLRSLCKSDNFWTYPIIKMAGEQRKILEKDNKLRECIFNKFAEKALKWMNR